MMLAQWAAWAFETLTGWRWHRKLRRETGEVYMDRWQFCRTRRLSVYINRINLPDADPLPHNHPWARSYSLKLKGSYIEEVYTYGPGPDDVNIAVGAPKRFNRIPQVHRIAKLTDGPCWTLFVGFDATKPWGFVEPGGFVIPANVRKEQRGVTSES
jgi:hypothetical protein